MRFLLPLAVICLLLAHASLGSRLASERPDFGLLPPLPSAAAARAMSFGDPQFLYRAFALQLQNAGDTGGRSTPMRNYNFDGVLSWLTLLQHLDSKSSYHTFLALRYFSHQRGGDELRQMIAFIGDDVALAPAQKWYWQTQIVAMARDDLKDLEFAMQLSRRIDDYAAYVPSGFMWVFQMEPLLLKDLGRLEDARTTMKSIEQKYGSRMTDPERAWTAAFYETLQ